MNYLATYYWVAKYKTFGNVICETTQNVSRTFSYAPMATPSFVQKVLQALLVHLATHKLVTKCHFFVVILLLVKVIVLIKLVFGFTFGLLFFFAHLILFLNRVCDNRFSFSFFSIASFYCSISSLSEN